MTEHAQHFNQATNSAGHTTTTRVVETRDVGSPDEEAVDSQNLASRIVWYVAGILLVLLAFRFVLAAAGANPANSFANFIYTASHLFVAPFFSLFSYNLRYGVSRFEAYTLVAMAVYALIAYGIARLLTINRRDYE